MRLTIRQKDELIFDVEIREMPTHIKLPSASGSQVAKYITGLRRDNDILLLKTHFDKFIWALSGDNFAECRQILAGALDIPASDFTFTPITGNRLSLNRSELNTP